MEKCDKQLAVELTIAYLNYLKDDVNCPSIDQDDVMKVVNNFFTQLQLIC